MDWDKLRIFQAVADAGSFTHAGESLKLSQSAISRQIGALEEQLGVMLFHRHARGLILTEQGELLYRTARDMAARVNTAEALLRANQDKPAGRLKVTTTIGFGSTWLTAQMHEFITTYPDIDVSLVLSDNELDLGMREADVAIRMVMPRQPGLVQRHLLTVRSHVYASHGYIQKYGKPKTVEELDQHRLVNRRQGQMPRSKAHARSEPPQRLRWRVDMWLAAFSGRRAAKRGRRRRANYDCAAINHSV